MHDIFGLKHVFSTFQETVWSHLKVGKAKMHFRMFNTVILLVLARLYRCMEQLYPSLFFTSFEK